MSRKARDDMDNVTGLLLEASAGNDDAMSELVPLVYHELCQIAARQLQNERANHTLQPTTALVHDVYLRLTDQSKVQWHSRSHFLPLAARPMRNILVDHARSRARQKRGGGRRRTSVELATDNAVQDVDILALDEALERLDKLASVNCQIVELRFFGGLSIEESAEALGISTGAVKRQWTSARAWLFREIHGDDVT